jgi:phosphoglycolate phosphatase
VRYEAVVFDFDGTLVDTIDLIVASYRAAWTAVDRPVPPLTDILRRIGLPLDGVLAEFGDGAGVDAMRTAYRERFLAGLETETRVYGGVPGLLEGLRARDVRLGIATSRKMPSLRRLLAVHGLAGHFATLASRSCVRRGKPHPEMLWLVLEGLGVAPDRTLLVGDTDHDVAMGRAAGVDTCAVAWGAQDEATLRAAEPTYLARSVDEVAGYSLR